MDLKSNCLFSILILCTFSYAEDRLPELCSHDCLIYELSTVKNQEDIEKIKKYYGSCDRLNSDSLSVLKLLQVIDFKAIKRSKKNPINFLMSNLHKLHGSSTILDLEERELNKKEDTKDSIYLDCDENNSKESIFRYPKLPKSVHKKIKRAFGHLRDGTDCPFSRKQKTKRYLESSQKDKHKTKGYKLYQDKSEKDKEEFPNSGLTDSICQYFPGRSQKNKNLGKSKKRYGLDSGDITINKYLQATESKVQKPNHATELLPKAFILTDNNNGSQPLGSPKTVSDEGKGTIPINNTTAQAIKNLKRDAKLQHVEEIFMNDLCGDHFTSKEMIILPVVNIIINGCKDMAKKVKISANTKEIKLSFEVVKNGISLIDLLLWILLLCSGFVLLVLVVLKVVNNRNRRIGKIHDTELESQDRGRTRARY
ncbi:hypothetical protein QYM36_004268 [Artemia franciscana]|uniref:Uncharacterized protein n=1 Tax=Artemia franciscana TaxID=6661 RepID=A0AA88HZX1_ARTSF|nr:hypothetical protein QYM36_004268 [Artemia franciscana]